MTARLVPNALVLAWPGGGGGRAREMREKVALRGRQRAFCFILHRGCARRWIMDAAGPIHDVDLAGALGSDPARAQTLTPAALHERS